MKPLGDLLKVKLLQMRLLAFAGKVLLILDLIVKPKTRGNVGHDLLKLQRHVLGKPGLPVQKLGEVALAHAGTLRNFLLGQTARIKVFLDDLAGRDDEITHSYLLLS